VERTSTEDREQNQSKIRQDHIRSNSEERILEIVTNSLKAHMLVKPSALSSKGDCVCLVTTVKIQLKIENFFIKNSKNRQKT